MYVPHGYSQVSHLLGLPTCESPEVSVLHTKSQRTKISAPKAMWVMGSGEWGHGGTAEVGDKD